MTKEKGISVAILALQSTRRILRHMQLTNKTAIVTGASGGIGSALIDILVKEGMRVYALDLKKIDRLSEGVTYFDADVTNAASIKQALSNIEEPIDLLINSAGVMRRGSILEVSPEDYDITMNVNVKGSWMMLKSLLPKFSKDAVIVQMVSRHALFPPEDPALYALSKIAVDRLLDFFEKSHPHYSVRRLYPGPTDTPLARHDVPAAELKEKEKKMFKPEDLAAQIVELLKEDKSKLVFDPKTWSHTLV